MEAAVGQCKTTAKAGKNETTATYVVTDNCIRCKYMDCVEVCPVDCFCEGENMLVINPSEWRVRTRVSCKGNHA